MSIIREEEENIAELPLYHLFDNNNNRYLTAQNIMTINMIFNI
ncbi:MAG: hypothetical protein AB8W37_06500 [Arsenophonus endosymbiont of Dermacentor nuttalli]